MLSLLLVLSGLGRLTSAGQNSETPLEIIVPQKLETHTSDGHLSEMHISYLLSFEGKTYTLLLENQALLHPNFLAYSNTKAGTLKVDTPLIKGHCFYKGHVAEIPRSVVTLSTCSGLRGLLQLENVSYGIEPLEQSATYEHMLYELKDNKIDYFPLKENYSKLQHVDQPYRVLVKPEKNLDVILLKRTLKIKVVMGQALYDYMGSEMGITIQKVVYVFALLNTMYSQVNVTVLLSTLEVWTDQNMISTDGDANEILQRFLLWQQSMPFQRFDDVTFLLLFKDSSDYVGAAYHGLVCNPKFAAGIALHPKMISLEAFSVVLAQLLGINLGMTYDDTYDCYCPEQICIMNTKAIHSRGIKRFSSCSVDQLKHIVSRPEFECLQNQKLSELIYQPINGTCGNGILEASEQCDCGKPEACAFRKCCDPTACTLIGLAQCGTGPCCNKRTCQVSGRGKLCRKSRDLCDFPEYCDGSSEFCVPDVITTDLEPCNNKSAYCFHGICRDPDSQCIELFGKYASNSSYLCSEEVNFQNGKFGDCLERCNFNFILCGKIVCQWTSSEVLSISDYDMPYLAGHVCLSARLRPSGKQTNTYVYDGAICGPNKTCLGGQCKLLNFSSEPNFNSKKKCQGIEVCNNLLNCHCDTEYSPPSCKETSSPGGSINDELLSNGYRQKTTVRKLPSHKVKVIVQ
ncbi:A disintegrin and metallopeptidase domain 3-like isoform X2 [Dipodomys merriami]|uniref:A disintegrin and metallopeptidase domain 3-like isoform X2 n=1 Tax=Dipodomys merriami TaxID=94247 RepID=UPI00384AFEB1